ncbi:NAD(P)-binding protein, partial [Aureobasidium melanogenum]
MSERAALSARAIPFMELSNGTDTSLTAPPPPLPHYLNAEGRAMARFAVEGNAVITGGAGTLALAAARALLEHGLANLFLFDLRSTFDTSDEAIEALHNDFPSAKIIIEPVDVTDAENVNRAFAAAAARGSIDILLCFAGVVGCLNAIEMTPDQWRRTIDINTTGSFLCAQAAAKQMQHQGTGGSIVFTASISGHRVNFPQPQAAYNVSKAAVIAMKDSLAAEWARKMSKIVVQVSLPPDRSSLANLVLLATHFQDKPSEETRKTIKLQPCITVPTELESIMPVPPVATELGAHVSEAFWKVFDGSLHDLARGTYKIDWVDEEEMEMNAGVPLLERSVALGRICEELWLAVMRGSYWENVYSPED